MTPPGVQHTSIEELELKRGEGFAGTPHAAGTEEYFVCLGGAFVVTVQGEEFKVNTGELLCFDGDVAHAYQAAADLARGLSVVVQVPRL